MTKTTKIIAAIAGLDFLAGSAYVAWVEGPMRLLALGDGTPNLWIWVVVSELLLALGVTCVYIHAHARAHGRNPWPFVAMTMVTGVFGPLLYVVMAPTEASTVQTLQPRHA